MRKESVAGRRGGRVACGSRPVQQEVVEAAGQIGLGYLIVNMGRVRLGDRSRQDTTNERKYERGMYEEKRRNELLK